MINLIPKGTKSAWEKLDLNDKMKGIVSSSVR
jgi:hypothetical protein